MTSTKRSQASVQRHVSLPSRGGRIAVSAATLIIFLCVIDMGRAWATPLAMTAAQTDSSSSVVRQTAVAPQATVKNQNNAAVDLSDTALGRSRTPQAVLNGTAKLIGAYNRAATLHVVIGLTHPKMAEEEAFLQQLQDRNSPNFHKYLTAEQWNARFAPSAQDEQAVADWATSNGLTVSGRFANRLIVDVEGTPEAFERAFALKINSYQLGANVEFSNDRDPVIPANLTSIMQSVGGLNSIQRVHAPHEGTALQKSTSDVSSLLTTLHRDGNPAAYQEAMKASAAKMAESSTILEGATGAASQLVGLQPQVTNGYLDPTDIYSSYGYDYGALQNQGHCCNPTNSGGGSTPTTSIGIATAYDFANSDIVGFGSQYPYLAYYISRIGIDGTPACCNDETTLDTEWSLATANSFGSYLSTSHVYVYEAANTYISTFTDVYNEMLSDGNARVFTTSWGCGELDCTSGGTMDTDHGIFNSMLGQGWTLMAASGDQGATADCGDADLVQYPSSDPDVVAVGGTSLALYSNGTFYSETGWQGATWSGACASNWGGSTGGCSVHFAVPGYQSSPVCGIYRSVPDVALNAGYGQNYYFNGSLSGAGGTSIAAPMVAGFMAQENAYLMAIGVGCGAGYAYSCAPMGQAQYPMYYEGNNPNYAPHYPYYDILSGCSNNDITAYYGLGYYCAGTGYDLVTGWGSFNALQLSWAISTYLAGAFNTPTVTFSGPPVSTGSYTWYNTDQTVSWTVTPTACCSYPVTGVAGYSAAWDAYFSDPTSEATQGTGNSFYSGPQSTNATSGSLKLSSAGQGCHFVDVDAWDNTGFTSGDQYYYWICYDTVAPTITISNSPSANSSGWNNSTVTVTLSATDPGGSGASGIYKTYYAVNSTACYPANLGGCSVYSSPFTVSGQGYNYVFYFTEDNAGNFSANAGSVYEWIYLDNTAPVTTAGLSGTLNGNVYNSAVQVTLSATDNLSGVQYTYYQLDGGASTTYSGAFSVTALGSHSVKYHSVDYAGNTEATKTATFTIAQASQTITFANPGTQTYGHPLTLTATASSGLPVSYTSTTTPVCTVSGSVVTFLSTGTCGILANQAGNTYVAPAPQVGHAWVVGKDSQTITFTNPGTQTYGHPLTLTATASSNLAVTYTSSTPTICTVSGSVVTFLSTGTCGVYANQAGNADYLAAPQVGHAWVVGKDSQTITFTNPGTQTYGHPLTLTATASSNLAVTYTSSTPTICTVSGSTANFIATGTCGVYANQAGNADYLAAPQVGHAWVVGKSSQTITFTNPGTQRVGAVVPLGATASSNLPVTYTSTNTSVCTVSGSNATMVATGTCGIYANQAGNVDYLAAPQVGHAWVVTH